MWNLFTASVQGASHIVAGIPNQDAVGSLGDPMSPDGGPAAVAVADGHGDPRHFRSGRGSRLAVEVACGVAAERAPSLAAEEDVEVLGGRLRTELAPEIVARWRAAVAHDLSREPLDDRELARVGGDAGIAYGSTLLVAILMGRWALLAQIGDGDILAVETGGHALAPLPPDPWNRGRFTSSLCQEDPLASFRVATIDLERQQLSLLLLATDGFGNSQVDDPWYQPFGSDLLQLVARHGSAWVGARLAEWAARCASSEGSGDDTTIALLVQAGRRR